MMKYRFFAHLAGLGVFLGVTATGAIAQPMSMPHGETPAAPTSFRRIEQPLGLKLAVTAGGMALMGLELWWFLFSKTRAT